MRIDKKIMIIKRDKLGRIIRGNGKKHGLSTAPIYDCWIAMKARCNNSQHPNYSNYGDRGIKVCDRWQNSFDNFFSDMGKKYKQGLTLDRIDNNGNYEPLNCRWITIFEQQRNRTNNNIVVGVHFEKMRKKWHADITHNGIKTFLGRFVNLEDAKRARENAEKNVLNYI